ncbi:MAG TPA: ABC transporter [Methanomicrobiales archaeon]|jgi:energy-coupling factor transport system ATP-binding protein|nr:ABC transporter [Methanomicrobiales archaeon]
MRVTLDGVILRRDGFCLEAPGTFTGGVHLVTGPVGSGKSTLALALAGALAPEAGRIVKEGITSLTLGLPSPGYQVTGGTLAAEAMAWGVSPEQVLGDAGLAGRGGDDPLRCSQGELKRLVLSCILARAWDLLILDEPYGSLDCAWKATLSRRLGERRSGITILLTHEDEYLPAVDEIWEIRAGRLVSLGRVPGAIAAWSRPPRYLRAALERGAVPSNITRKDAREAVCRTRG